MFQFAPAPFYFIEGHVMYILFTQQECNYIFTNTLFCSFLLSPNYIYDNIQYNK